MKQIIVPVGLPGSGKTSFIKQHRKDHPLATSCVICGDDLRLMLNQGDYEFCHILNQRLLDMIVEMTRKMIKVHDCVYVDEYCISDTVFHRDIFTRNFCEYDVQFFALPADLGTCIHRRVLDTRESNTSRWPDVLMSMADTFEPYVGG